MPTRTQQLGLLILLVVLVMYVFIRIGPLCSPIRECVTHSL